MWRALLSHPETEQQATESLPEADSESVPSTPKTPPSNRKKKKAKMELIKSLVSKRGQAKGKLTRIWNSLQVPHEDEPVQVSLPQLKVHQRSIEKYYGEFMEVHDKVMEVIPENQREEHENKLLEFEDLYNSTLVLIETLLTDRAAVGHSQLLVPAGPGGQPQPQVIVHQQSLRAPLPVFDGKYENWPKFKSMWTDLMKTSPDSNAVKLFHLEKSLVGQAAGIIDTKTIQDNNYDHAWAVLEERFENERRLIDIHIEGLLKDSTIRIFLAFQSCLWSTFLHLPWTEKRGNSGKRQSTMATFQNMTRRLSSSKSGVKYSKDARRLCRSRIRPNRWPSCLLQRDRRKFLLPPRPPAKQCASSVGVRIQTSNVVLSVR